MQTRGQWLFAFIFICGVLLLVKFIREGNFFNHRVNNNHTIDSVNVVYGNSYHTIYLTDTLNFAGEQIPVTDSLVRAHLKYIISTNMNWFPRAYNELVQYPEVFNSIRQRLISQGVPPDFIYLAFNESHLENVKSTNSMCGLWQLEANTARRFGLCVDSAADERFDITKSTVVAARYISYLHSLYGDWIVAAAAYNTGPGLINYDFQYLKVKNKKDFFENYYLSGYMMHIIAFKVIFNYAAAQLARDKRITSRIAVK